MHEEPYFWFLPESDGFSSKGFSPDRRFVLPAAFRAVRFTCTGSSGRKIRFSAKSNNRLSTHYGLICILFPRILTRILSDGGDIRSLPPQRLILLRLVRTLRVPSETEALCYFFCGFPAQRADFQRRRVITRFRRSRALSGRRRPRMTVRRKRFRLYGLPDDP
jgi:hypothetical protein